MKLVIIGNGIAGVSLARMVASAAPETDIALYTDESYTYYPRPKLVSMLAGVVAPEELPAFGPDWYAQRGIVNHLEQRVAEIRPLEHQIVLSDGAVVAYDKLVLATGAHAWVPPTPGSDLAHVYTLRTLADAQALRARALNSRQAVALGGGLLGLDSCAALLATGVAITVVEMLPRLLPRQLDAEGAAVLQTLLEQRGLSFITGDVAASINGRDAVENVQLKGGATLPADLVLVSAGVRSNIALAQQAGIDCNHGILVNERLLTSAEDVYAIGDCAEFAGHVWGIIPAATAQARVAAAQLTGDATTLYTDIVPSTTLKVSGIDLTSVGDTNPTDDQALQLRLADVDAGLYKKVVLRDGRLVGAIVLGQRQGVRALEQLMERGVDLSAHTDHLLDPAFDPASLLK